MVRVRPEDGDVSARRVTEALAGHDSALPPTAAVPLVPSTGLPTSGQVDLYRAAARDAGLDEVVRLQALRALVREAPGDTAVTDVREVLATAGEGPLLAGAAGLLARLGGGEDLALLERVAAGLGPADPRRRVRFASVVLAHRHGLPDPAGHVAMPLTGDDDPGPDALVVTSALLRGEDRAGAVEAAAAESPQLADGTPDVVSVGLGGRSVVLVIRDGVDGGARLAQVPDLPGVVLTADPEHGDLVPAFLVLTDPDDGAVAVRVCRPDGTPVLAGRGTVGEAGLRARLTGVRSPGSVPAALDVDLGGPGPVVSGLLGRRRHAKRVPTRLPD